MLNLSLLGVLVGGYIIFSAGLYFFQSHLIYFPDRVLVTTPDKEGLGYQTASFEAWDGVKLSGWFMPADEAKGVVLFFHGNAGNISHRIHYARFFHRMGLSVFLFDYRGYGESGGRPSEQGTYYDAEAALRYLAFSHKLPPSKIIFFGESLGGAVAAWLAQRHKPMALILQSSFTSIPDMASEIYPYLPARWLARFDYNTVTYLQGIRCPLVVIHSREDEIVPFSHGRRLFDAAVGVKTFLEIRGPHNEGFLMSEKEVEADLTTFLARYVR